MAIQDNFKQISLHVVDSEYFEPFHPFQSAGFTAVLEHCRNRTDGKEWAIFGDIGGIVPHTDDIFITERRLLVCSKYYRLPENINYPVIQLATGKS